MNDIETVVRDSLHYDGDLHPLASAPIIRRARRRRHVRRAGTGLAASGLAVASFAAWASWPQPATQVVAVQPAPSPSPAPTATDGAVLLESTDRVTTKGGAVIVVTPDELCVGNTHEEPSCLAGIDPTLDDPSSGMGWYTTSPPLDFVYAWLTPEGTAQATLHVEGRAPQEATLYQVEGRKMRIAVVTGMTCWSNDTSAEQVGTDVAGEVVYAHSAGGTCPDSLPPATP